MVRFVRRSSHGQIFNFYRGVDKNPGPPQNEGINWGYGGSSGEKSSNLVIPFDGRTRQKEVQR